MFVLQQCSFENFDFYHDEGAFLLDAYKLVVALIDSGAGERGLLPHVPGEVSCLLYMLSPLGLPLAVAQMRFVQLLRVGSRVHEPALIVLIDCLGSLACSVLGFKSDLVVGINN